MSNVQQPYFYTQKGRSVYALATTGLAAALGFAFFLTRDTVFIIAGVFMMVLVASGIFAFVKGETWSMIIENGVLSWSYARWPKSEGQIDLSTVSSIVIYDSGSTLELSFAAGVSRKIKLIGYGAKLRDYLVRNYPHIDVKFVEGT